MNELWIAIKELRNEKVVEFVHSDEHECVFETEDEFIYTSPFAYAGDVMKIKDDQGEESLMIKSVRIEKQRGVFFYVYEYERAKMNN